MARFARFGWGSVPAARAALSRLVPYRLGQRCVVRFWMAVAVLWDRGRFLYRLNVNVLLMGWWVVGCYRWTAYPSYGLSSVLDERKRALVVV